MKRKNLAGAFFGTPPTERKSLRNKNDLNELIQYGYARLLTMNEQFEMRIGLLAMLNGIFFILGVHFHIFSIGTTIAIIAIQLLLTCVVFHTEHCKF